MLPARELQRRFLAALAPAPRGVASPAAPASGPPGAPDSALVGLIEARGALGATGRLAIYADMYRARLVDALREDFPAVRAVTGDEGFAALAHRYLVRHPPDRPSLRHAGRHFAAFLFEEATGSPFLPDLARLEWARVEVFDAPDAIPMTMADLAGVPPADWAGIPLSAIPACAVLDCDWPVHEIWVAAHAAGAPGSSTDAGPSVGSPPTGAAVGPAPTAIRIWREGFAVSHAAITPMERQALALLQCGLPFAELCAALEDRSGAEAATHELARLLLRWIEDGLLVRPSP